MQWRRDVFFSFLSDDQEEPIALWSDPCLEFMAEAVSFNATSPNWILGYWFGHESLSRVEVNETLWNMQEPKVRADAPPLPLWH